MNVKRYNVKKEKWQEIRLFGKPALFSPLRFSAATLPTTLYMYEVEHHGDGTGDPVQLGAVVSVNFFGTVITEHGIHLNKDLFKDIEASDWAYCPEDETTLKEFLWKYPLNDRRIPAKDTRYYTVKVFGRHGLFTQKFIDPNTIPDGLYMYEVQGVWENQNTIRPSHIRKKVFSGDFVGTLIYPSELVLYNDKIKLHPGDWSIRNFYSRDDDTELTELKLMEKERSEYIRFGIAGKNLRNMRRERGITQRELGDIIGAKPGDVSKYERGVKSLSLEAAISMCYNLGVSISELGSYPEYYSAEDISVVVLVKIPEDLDLPDGIEDLREGKTGFLISHNKKKGGYALPGGKVEHGESIRRAAVRELEEELNLHLKPSKVKIFRRPPIRLSGEYPIGSGSLSYFEQYIYVTKLDKADMKDLKNNEPDKCSNIKCIPLDDIGNINDYNPVSSLIVEAQIINREGRESNGE